MMQPRETGQLWFDVEIIRYTTGCYTVTAERWLWFDVEIIRYTTKPGKSFTGGCCGLM